ncbi:MAG TPA: HAMP domain-containing sensor histidine kinase [Anaerolineaceae bacterium]
MKLTTRDAFTAALPVLLCAAAAAALHCAIGELPVLRLRADIGTALILVGAAASLILLVFLLTRRTGLARSQREIAATDQTRAEARRRFIHRLDHELKNPLTAMRAALANFPLAQTGEDQERLLTDVRHQAERVGRLVADLRKLAELEERPIELLPVDLDGLLCEVVEVARANPAYAGRDLKLVVSQVPWRLPAAVGDRDLLALAFYNLIENALKFTKAQDSVEVRAQEDGRALIVEVADTGPGIPAEDLPRIFEELYRGANARGFEGSGLGLALVQLIVARHGGDVSVRSRPGQGTVFTVRLPMDGREREPRG